MSNHSSPQNLKNMVFAGRDKAAEVAERRKIQEKEREAKLEAKKREQEEKLMRIAEQKNRELQEKLRLKAQKELEKSKAALDRRAAQLEQDKARKQEILQKAHSASSRTAQTSPKKIFAFGSSTPRELSYLEKLAKDQKQYDKKLAPIDGSTGGSPNASPPRQLPVKKPAPMTASLYVPSKPMSTKPIAKENHVSPKKVLPAKVGGMTQSMYDPGTKPKPLRQSLLTTTKPVPPKRSLVDNASKKPPMMPAKVLHNSPKKLPESRKTPTKKIETKKPTVAPESKAVPIAIPRKNVQLATAAPVDEAKQIVLPAAEDLSSVAEKESIEPSVTLISEPMVIDAVVEKKDSQPDIEVDEEEVRHDDLIQNEAANDSLDATQDSTEVVDEETISEKLESTQDDIESTHDDKSLDITQDDVENIEEPNEHENIQVHEKVKFVEEPNPEINRESDVLESVGNAANQSLNISQLVNDLGNLNLVGAEVVPEDPVAVESNSSAKSNHTDDELEALDTARIAKQELIKPAADNDLLTDPRTESPDSGNALSASSSPKESDSENNEIVRPAHDYARENRRAKLTEILSMARGTGSPTAQLKQAVDPAQLAKEVLEQRRQMRNVNSGSDLQHSTEGNDVTATVASKGVNLSLAEELKEASRQSQTNDVLPGQVVYDGHEQQVHQV
uniref:Uncharacterized protein n=1 Tax=Panagrolaimus sp. JU765 TaxID=591449 RepID=A0AC34R3Z2_9BILA